ncbi:uncharacterized protein LOC113790553 [Dermatophagoides pteronyssinus]|uniref:uncharacterized protein LOC113790553 n=1 Tax=Dermatophagoides pteronyssinus TaxID=6956 RepID=UPI003F6672A8
MSEKINSNPNQMKCYDERLDLISVNPFVNHHRKTGWIRLYTYTIGLFLFVIRFPPFVLFVLMATLVAKITLIMISIGKFFRLKTEFLRTIGRNVSIFILRTGLFFAGFYWIRMVDQRPTDRRHTLAPIICAAPHSSFFDILLILKLENPTFVSRKENIHTPLIGNILRLYNGIYVDRHDKNSRIATIQAIMERTSKHAEHVLVFPEGTTANRKALLQFKLGAFLPRLPIQPVLIRYETCCGIHDPITWTWEGPGVLKIFFYTMSCLSIDCEITIMDEYRPNSLELQDPKKFAQNVAQKMCIELGIPQSYYSYDDVPLMHVAKQFGLFRSPICIMMLKIAEKIRSTILNKTEKFDDETDPNSPKTPTPTTPTATTTTTPKSNDANNGTGTVTDCQNQKSKSSPKTNNSNTADSNVKDGQNSSQKPKKDDLEYLTTGYSEESVIESYKPISIGQSQSSSSSSELAELQAMSMLATDNVDDSNEFQYLPISKVKRKLFRSESFTFTTIDDDNRLLYEIFSRLIEHCITKMEKHFHYRPIKSSKEIPVLLKLFEFIPIDSTLRTLNTIFMDLVKMLQMTVSIPITTIHLLIILHLCDIREKDLWERIRIVIRLFNQMHPKTTNETNNMEPYLTMNEFQTFLWYSLGLNEFNNQYFLQHHFDYRYIRENLCRLFFRAVNENAPQLIPKQLSILKQIQDKQAQE